MSKKNRRKFQLGGQQNASPAPAAPRPISAQDHHVAEYRIIRNDLIRVLVVNLTFLAAILVLYFSNLHNNYLERFYNSLF